MAMSTEDLQAMIRQDLSDAFLRRALRAVFAAHKDSHDLALASYQPTEANNVMGFMRRASLEGYLRDAALMSDGIDVETVHGPDSNWNHIEVRSGSLVLTECSVPYPCQMADRSNFRDTLAEGNQPGFWEEPSAAGEVLVLLVHSKYRASTLDDLQKNGHMPGSAYLACPSPNFKSYLCEINLFDLFPDLVASLIPNSWDEEALVRYQYNARKAAWPRSRRAN